MILDEPTVGLDPKQVMQIRALIKSLGKNHTVILSSHILSEVNQICEKVIIMNKGEIVTIDTPENLENNVKTENSLLVTIEESKENIEDIVKTLENVKSISLIKTLPDGTKQYSITPKGDVDIRKEVSEGFSKNNITIFELKKVDATLEEAFIELIDKQKQETKPKERQEIKGQKDKKKGGKK